MTAPALELTDLRVDYGTFTAVRDLTLTVERGEIYGLVGPNGAGKTTTLKVIATLLLPSHGTVRIAGFPLSPHPREPRARLGYMPDLAPIIGNLRVREFLDLFAACHQIPQPRRRQRIDQCLQLTGMTDHREALCATLSRGMTQRVILAKTLLHQPELLLLDEPASGMDPIARMELKDTLQAVASEGTTVLLSSHILSELTELATSVGILHQGRLRHHGPVEEVLATRQRDAHHITIDLLHPDQAASCRRWLQARFSQAELPAPHGRQPQRIEAELPGSPADQANLLAALTAAGFAVTGFSIQRTSLEDLLRDLTNEAPPPS